MTSTTAPRRSHAHVRATLRPGTVIVIRDAQTLQVGLAPDRAVAVRAPARCGPEGLAALLNGLRGGATLAGAAALARVHDDDMAEVARILVRLSDLGFVQVRRPGASSPPSVSPGPRPAPVRRVYIHGTGQVTDVLRGPLSVNGCRVTSGASNGSVIDPLRPPWNHRGAPPDLVLLTDSVAVDPLVSGALTRAGQAHMHVYGRDGRVVVGPTVLPGASPCLRCMDMFRAQRDPRWPFVTAQLVDQVSEASVPALTAAAALVLSEIAASRSPELPLQTIGATVEISPAEGMWNRLEWPVVAGCDCEAPAYGCALS